MAWSSTCRTCLPCPTQKRWHCCLPGSHWPMAHLWDISDSRGRAEQSFSCCVHICSTWQLSQQNNTNHMQVVPSPEPPRAVCSCSFLLSSFPLHLPDQRGTPKGASQRAHLRHYTANMRQDLSGAAHPLYPEDSSSSQLSLEEDMRSFAH